MCNNAMSTTQDDLHKRFIVFRASTSLCNSSRVEGREFVVLYSNYNNNKDNIINY